MHYVFYPLVAVVCLAIGVLGGWIGRKRIGEAEIGSAEAKAQSIIDEAVKLGETKKKEALIEAKEEILQNKNETERELKERRAEISRRGKDARFAQPHRQHGDFGCGCGNPFLRLLPDPLLDRFVHRHRG